MRRQRQRWPADHAPTQLGHSAPPPPPPPPVIGVAGGTISEGSGASVIVPAGAIDSDTTIRIAMDSTGAPALPVDLTAAGNTYVITPHGGNFAQAVEVRIPVPAVTLLPTQELKLAKAQPGGEWELLMDSEVSQGTLVGKVTSFSYFASVIVNYPLPILQFQKFSVTTKLDCGDRPCDKVVGPITATFSVTSNNGQLPTGCRDEQLYVKHGADGIGSFNQNGFLYPDTPIERNGSLTLLLVPRNYYYTFSPGLRCSGNTSFRPIWWELNKSVEWAKPPAYPRILVVRMPSQLDVVEGMPATLDAILQGGASQKPGAINLNINTTLTPADSGVIEWQRSDDNGASWRVIARSFEYEGNSLPFGTGIIWTAYGVRHGFIATAADQGALIRAKACYTPLDVAALPCDTSRRPVSTCCSRARYPHS